MPGIRKKHLQSLGDLVFRMTLLDCLLGEKGCLFCLSALEIGEIRYESKTQERVLRLG
jgi:hypothetical protein